MVYVNNTSKEKNENNNNQKEMKLNYIQEPKCGSQHIITFIKIITDPTLLNSFDKRQNKD